MKVLEEYVFMRINYNAIISIINEIYTMRIRFHKQALLFGAELQVISGLHLLEAEQTEMRVKVS